MVAAALAMATPAQAAALAGTGDIPINGDHVPTTAAQFPTKQCTGPFEDLDLGTDGWHFVLPSASGGSFVSVTLTFNSGAADFPVTVDAIFPAIDSDAGLGWSGYITNAGPDNIHLYLFTPSGWTLKAGVATVTNPGPGPDPEKPNDKGSFFNLSHVCVGTSTTPTPGITTTTTPPVTTTTLSTSATTVTTPGTTPTDPSLPTTGAALSGIILAGVGLVAGGVTLMVLRRRRDMELPTETPAE
jgi:LPXTG-motif cell wall-anchored protein